MGAIGPFEAKDIEKAVRPSATEKYLTTLLERESDISLNRTFGTNIDPDILEKYGADSEEAQQAYADIAMAWYTLNSHYGSTGRDINEFLIKKIEEEFDGYSQSLSGRDVR